MRLVLSERSPLSLLPKRARFVLGSHLARIEGIKRTACPTRAKRGMTNPETASPFFMSQVQASDLIPHHRTIVVGDTLLGSSPHPGILGVGWLEGVGGEHKALTDSVRALCSPPTWILCPSKTRAHLIFSGMVETSVFGLEL